MLIILGIAFGIFVYGFADRLGKNVIRFSCAGHLQSFCDVFFGPFRAQGLDLVANADALKKGPAFRVTQFFVQLRLAHQENVDEFFFRSLHVRKETDLFKEVVRKLVGFIDKKEKTPLLLGTPGEKASKARRNSALDLKAILFLKAERVR
jgi:hypothetical protein